MITQDDIEAMRDCVSPHSFGDREEHYRKSYGFYDIPLHERHNFSDMPYKMAQMEMLNEIHVMLRRLCGVK